MRNNGFKFDFMYKELIEVQNFKDAVSNIKKYRHENGDAYDIDELKDIAEFISNIVGDGLDDWLSGLESKNNSTFSWTLNVYDIVKEFYSNQYDTELTEEDQKDIENKMLMIFPESSIKEDILLVMEELIIFYSSELADVGFGNHRQFIEIKDGYDLSVNIKQTKEETIKNITDKNNAFNNYRLKRNQLKINGNIYDYENIADKCYSAFKDEIEIYSEKILRDGKYLSNFNLNNIYSNLTPTLLNLVIRYVFFDRLCGDYGINLDSIKVEDNGRVSIDSFDIVSYKIYNLISDDDII